MALEHDRASFGAESFARVFVRSPGIGPGDDRDTFDPRREGRAVGDDGDVDRFAFVAQDGFCVLASEDRTRAGVDGPSSVFFESVVDLAFIAIHVFAGDASEEDPRVDIFGEGQRGGLQAEVGVWL